MIKISSNTPSDARAVYWAITKFCDKACHYCAASEFVLTTKKKGNILNYTDEQLQLHDHIAQMLPNLVKKGNILFFGGEPTLHPKCIEYFNEMCNKTKDNKELTMFLITHGDVDEEKIEQINNHCKEECIISISYHYYQVKDFDRWLSRVKLFNEKFHTIVSALVPRRPAVWDDFEKNILKLEKLGVPFELKAELDQLTNNPDFASLKRFEELHKNAASTRSDFLNKYYNKEIYLDEGSTRVVIPDSKDLGSIPISANNTICNNKTLCIVENVLSWACGEGKTLPITMETTLDTVQGFLDQNKIMCSRNTCTENRQVQSNITVINASLKDERYKKFLNTWGKND